MSMNSPNTTSNKYWDSNLHSEHIQIKIWVLFENLNKHGQITMDAKIIVAETVVAPFPPVATWKRYQ